MPVLQRTTPVLLCTTKYYASTTCTTKYYSSTTLYYKVLRQYYFVLQSTTTYYSSTTLYYKGLRQYYSVLQSTTTYYSSTTLYYKGLRQYYSVLQSTTTYYSSTALYYKGLRQYYSVLQSTKRHFQCAEQGQAPCNLTKYCACHAKCKSSMICVTYETSFPMRGATRGSLQLHQLLRLPHKMNVISDLRHISNVISNARSKQRHPATSPNIAPGTQNECHQWSASHMKPPFQCVEQVKSPSNLTKYCACHAKCKSSMICVTYATSFPMRGGSKVTLQPHQILRLPRNLEAQDFSGNSLNASANRKTIRR